MEIIITGLVVVGVDLVVQIILLHLVEEVVVVVVVIMEIQLLIQIV
jgi:hypothetical protein